MNKEFEIEVKLDDSHSDIAVLKFAKSKFMHKPRDGKGGNECILTGNLHHERHVPITVIGCPFNDTFQVNSHNYLFLRIYSLAI